VQKEDVLKALFDRAFPGGPSPPTMPGDVERLDRLAAARDSRYAVPALLCSALEIVLGSMLLVPEGNAVSRACGRGHKSWLPPKMTSGSSIVLLLFFIWVDAMRACRHKRPPAGICVQTGQGSKKHGRSSFAEGRGPRHAAACLGSCILGLPNVGQQDSNSASQGAVVLSQRMEMCLSCAASRGASQVAVFWHIIKVGT